MRKESQDSCSVDDGNIFDQGIDDSGCQNVLFNCLKNTEIFNVASTANENQLESAKQLNDLIDAVEFIREKLEEYE